MVIKINHPCRKKGRFPREIHSLLNLKDWSGKLFPGVCPGYEKKRGGIWVNGNFYGWQNLEENPGLVQKLIGTIRQFIERYTVEQAGASELVIE